MTERSNFILTEIKRCYNSNDRWKLILFFIRRENDLNKWLKHVKGGTESKWNENKSTRNKWGPLRVHRMNWKVRFREHTGWRPKNDEEHRRTVENLREITHGNVTEAPRLGFSLRKQFFSLISSDSRITKRAEHFFHSPLPLFIGKCGRGLPPNSPNFLEGPSGPGCYLHPHFY